MPVVLTESTAVQPAGSPYVTVLLLLVMTSTSPSPACTEAGTVTLAEVALTWLAAVARNAIGSVTGGAAVTVTDFVAVVVAPSLSVTLSVTAYVPPAAYVWVAVAPADVPPSPHAHEYEATVPSGSPDPAEVAEQSSPEQVTAALAVGGVFAASRGPRNSARERQSTPSTDGPLTTVAGPLTVPPENATLDRFPSARVA